MAIDRRSWLPDFCRLPRIAALLAIAELVVIIIAVAPTEVPRWNPAQFAIASVFALWLALIQAVIYCKCRGLIGALPRPLGIAVALLLPLAISVLAAWVVQRLDVGLQTGFTLPQHLRWHFVGGIAALSVLISGLSLRYFYVLDQWRAQVNAQAKAEVDALQARIRPHFLFNSMNTIASLVRRDPLTAERALEDLSDLFRAALGVGQGESTLAEEIYLAERYLAIEALRLGDRLRVDWRVAEDVPKQLRLPRLVLQPLVENAVLHGVSRLAGGGTIMIVIARDARQLLIRIGNPSLAPGQEREVGHGHAQESIGQRLAYQFGPQARMTGHFGGGYYECVITLPLT
jgi:two-component system sensor histidine kinase AlgZ